MTPRDGAGEGRAIISPCGTYRYRLERPDVFGDFTTAIIMVNPSTADAVENDATIRKLIGFRNRWGWGHIVVGDVSPSKVAKTHMAKSSLDAGWSDFKCMLSYKSHLRGGRMVEVDERYSSQVCSACGSLPLSRPRGIADLGKRNWECDDCGAVHDRDVNAALNIRRVGLDTLIAGAVI